MKADKAKSPIEKLISKWELSASMGLIHGIIPIRWFNEWYYLHAYRADILKFLTIPYDYKSIKIEMHIHQSIVKTEYGWSAIKYMQMFAICQYCKLIT